MTHNKNNTYEKNIWLSFIMSILVMYIHANNLRNVGLLYSYKSIDWILTRIISDGIGSVAVPFFFMLSGVHFFTFHDGSKGSIEEIKNKMIKRIKTLVIPYVLWNLFCFLFYYVLTHTAAVRFMNDTSVVELTAVNLFKAVILHKNNFPFWYLQDLILFILFCPVIYAILNHKWLSKLTLLLLALLSVAIYSNISGLFFFVMGGYIAFYHREVIEKTCDNNILKCLCVVILLALIVLKYMNLELLFHVLLLVSPLAVWIAFENFKFPRAKWFIKQSFFIYACHVIPITIIMKVIAKLSIKMKSDFACAVAYLITPWITLFIIYIIASLLNKFFPRIYKILSGGR